MQRSDGPGGPPGRTWVLRLLAGLLVAAVLLPGAGPTPPAPDLALASATDPAPPTDVVAASADRALAVSWTAPAEATITGYSVYLDGTLAASPATTSVTLTGLVNGRGYVVTVVTRSSVLGFPTTGSTASSPVSGTPRDAVLPAAPTRVTATRGDGRVTLSWTENTADYDADGYRVLRDGAPVTGLLAGRSTSGWTDTAVVNDVTYAYTVQTHDTSGNWSTASAPAASATPTDLTPPAAPTGLVGGRGDGRAGLSWTAGTEADLAGYRVLRDGVDIAAPTAPEFLDVGLTNDRTYVYAVVAVDTHGNRSAASSSVSVTPTDLTPPAAPTGLTAMRGDAWVSLSWEANAEPDLASYQLRRDGVTIATLTGTTTHVDTGLTNDTTYRYTLAAVDTHGNTSVSSSSVSATPTDLGAPGTPSGLSATAGDGQVALSWTAVTDADVAGYRVLRDGAEIASVTGTSHTDTGLTNDRSYSYAVLAVDGHGNRSAASTPVPATPTDLTAPAVPAGLTAVAGDGQVGLSWTANPEDDLAGYRVFRDGIEIAAVGGTAYTADGLVDDTSYSFSLVAVDTHGNRSGRSAAVSATPTDLTPPAAPTGLVVARTAVQADLSWTANAEPDLASYRVLRDGVEIATVTGTGYTDAQSNEISRTYALVAVDTHGNRSAASAPVTSEIDSSPPAVPTGLAAVRGDGQVTLSWTANAEADLAGYRVLRDGVEFASVTTTTYVASGLVNDTTYGFALVAVDEVGNRSAGSSPVPATPTDLTAPAVPTGLTAMGGDGQVALSWTASTEADMAGYLVFRDGVEIASVTGTTYVATGLVGGTSYGFSLVAVDTHGNRSARSGDVSATPADRTAPATPAGLVAVAGERQVTLSWTANTETDLASYRVFRDGVEIATVAGTSHVVTGLVDDTTYAFSLVAVDTQGNRSARSAPVPATPTDGTPPAVPTGLTAVPGDGEVGLSWSGNSEPDLAGYRVFRDGVEIASVPATTSTYVDPGLPNDVAYAYSLVALDTHGNRSARSAPVSATPTDRTPPATPTGFGAVAGEDRVTLSWTANAEADLAGYRVLRDGADLASVTRTSYVDTGLSTGVTYAYSLVAVDRHGNRSAATAVASATPWDMAPAAPSDVAADPGDRRAVIRWTAPADADVVAYRVLTENGTVAATATAPATQVAVTGLVNGTSYSFTVVAVDAGGTLSPPSSPVTVVPASPPVPALGAGESSGSAVSADGRYVVVGTRAALEPGDTNTAYELYLLDRTAGTARRLAPLPASATGATDPTNTSAPVISADGRAVVLATRAALVPGDTNGQADAYRYDTGTAAWSLVSAPAGGGAHAVTAGAVLQTGTSVYATSPSVALTADGDTVLFFSARTDLVAGDTNGLVDLFAKRISTGTVTRVSTTTTGGNLTGAATGPALEVTPDGRFALFPAAVPDGTVLLYRKTLSGAGAGELVLVSAVPAPGGQVQFGVFRDTGDVAISDDGRYVAFTTASKITTPTPGAVGSTGLAYRMDLSSRAVVALGNGQQTGWEHQVELDPTGRYAFFSTAAGQLAGDTNGRTDHYRRDLAGGAAGPLVLVTADADGRATGGPTGSVTPAEYGRLTALTGDRVVVTTSQALVSADTNKIRDLYLKDLLTGAVSSPLG